MTSVPHNHPIDDDLTQDQWVNVDLLSLMSALDELSTDNQILLPKRVVMALLLMMVFKRARELHQARLALQQILEGFAVDIGADLAGGLEIGDESYTD